jgi:uncharacterized protein YggE
LAWQLSTPGVVDGRRDAPGRHIVQQLVTRRRPAGMTANTIRLDVRRVAAVAVLALLVAAIGIGIGYQWGGHSGSAGRSSAGTAGAAALASTGGTSSGAAAGITVTGTGTVSGTPDALHLAMGVAVTKPTVSAALEDANAAAAKVQDSLRRHGVADKDLQTSGLSIQAQYADAGGGRSTITGYQVSESLTATLRDLKTAGAAISEAATAGGDATRVDGVTLDLTDTSSLVAAARKNAYTQAKQKAQHYADAAGIGVGDVLSIQESVSTPSPVGAMAVPMATAAASVPIAAGSQQVDVTVTVVFAIS